MTKTGTKRPPGRAAIKPSGCCRVESVVTVDERGQMVLPKDLRDKAGIRAGDKLALVAWEKNGRVCCISLVKSEEFAAAVRGALGPMMKDVLGRRFS